MKRSQYILLTKQRFLPLFLTQFFGSLNDNFFRSALAVLIAFEFTGSSISWLNAGVMVALCSVLLVIPFPVLSPLAGQLADKYDKAILIRIIKIFELMIMGWACYGFIYNHIYLLMFLLLLSGIQSAFFGPLKYSIIADHMPEEELLAGNSLLSGATYTSILLGLTMGGLAFGFGEASNLIIGTTLFVGAVIGLVSSMYILPTVPASPELKVNKNVLFEAVSIIRHVKNNRPVFLSIVGLSWFMLISAIFMGQFPIFAKAIGTNNEVYTLFLIVFSIGVSVGSLLCNNLLKGEISARYTPLAVFAMSVFMILLVMQANMIVPSKELIGVAQFLSYPEHWLLIASMFAMAISGGVYIVPLYTIMQARAENSHRARVIAARNVLNSIFITIAMLISAVLLAVGLNLISLYLLLAVLNLGAAIWACFIVPEIPNKLLKKIGCDLIKNKELL